MLYTIKPGDTLVAIARMHGVSIKALLDANRDSMPEPGPLPAGGQLHVPEKPPAADSLATASAAPVDGNRNPGEAPPVASLPEKFRPLEDDFDFQPYREEFEQPPWTQRSGLLAGVLTIVLLSIIAVVWLFGYNTYSLKKENADLRTNLTSSQAELIKLREDVNKFQKDIDALLKGQLPGLTKIEYDQVIPINQSYVKNITFNRVNNRNVRGYEFRVVMRNDTLSTIWPKMKINFFSKHGLQINFIQVSAEKDAFLQIDTLNPGEERADSSPVISLLEQEELPTYFMMQVN